MSSSDSDSELDFESADEGSVDGSISLSDLSDDENNKKTTATVAKVVTATTRPKEKEAVQSSSSEDEVDKEPKSLEVKAEMVQDVATKLSALDVDEVLEANKVDLKETTSQEIETDNLQKAEETPMATNTEESRSVDVEQNSTMPKTKVDDFNDDDVVLDSDESDVVVEVEPKKTELPEQATPTLASVEVNKQRHEPIVEAASLQKQAESDTETATKITESVKQITPSPPQPIVPEVKQHAAEAIVKSEEPPKADVSGWNDTEFCDVVEDDLSDSEPQEQPQAAKDNAWAWQERIEVKPKIEVKQPEPAPTQSNNNNSGGGGWSWAKFGSSLINTASTITTQFGDSLTSVIGAPDPLELARKTKEENEKYEEIQQNESKTDDPAAAAAAANDWNDRADWFSVLPINKLTSTGIQFVSGSLDVLESVGKKTIEVINDKDPNLRQTKELFKKATTVGAATKPNLSQLLRQAQEEATTKDQTQKDEAVHQQQQQQQHQKLVHSQSKHLADDDNVTFSNCFDDYKGTAHLEALEMLSRQTNVKFDMQNKYKKSVKIDALLKDLSSIFQMDDDFEDEGDEDFDINNFAELVIDYISELNTKLSPDRIIQSYRTASHGCTEVTSTSQYLNESIKCFALITATLIEFYHKLAEYFLVQQQNNKKVNDTMHKAKNISQLTKLCIRSVHMIANQFCKKYKATVQDTKSTINNQIITNIYLEASNSNTYTSDAFMLLSPIFKFLSFEEYSISNNS